MGDCQSPNVFLGYWTLRCIEREKEIYNGGVNDNFKVNPPISLASVVHVGVRGGCVSNKGYHICIRGQPEPHNSKPSVL